MRTADPSHTNRSNPGNDPVVSDEVEFDDLTRLIRAHWILVLGLALSFGLATYLFYQSVPESQFEAAATLLPTAGAPAGGQSIDFYRSLLESKGVVDQVARRLEAEGHWPEGRDLVVGGDLFSETETYPGRDRARATALVLRARSEDPKRAAEMVNTWAKVFIEESGSMLRSSAAESVGLLEAQIATSREELEATEKRRTDVIKKFVERERETASRWDREIWSRGAKAGEAMASFQAETRRLFEEELEQILEQEGASLNQVESEFFELVALRTELSRTPRVLDLEKTASDEELAEMLISIQETDLQTPTLISQELDPLHGELSLAVLDLERRIRRQAGSSPGVVSKALARLESLQLERAAKWTARSEMANLEQRLLRRSRSDELRDLVREKATAMAYFSRQLEQQVDLDGRLLSNLNQNIVADVLERVDAFRLVAPAAAPLVEQSRRVALKSTLAFLVGGFLGLLIALLRTAEPV